MLDLLTAFGGRVWAITAVTACHCTGTTSALVGSVAGGIAERALDGDDSTEAFSATDIRIDALAGATGGFAGHKVTGMVNDMTYALRQSTYEAFEQDLLRLWSVKV